MAGGFEVDVPDIGIVEFPEGTTEDEAQNAIRRHRLTPTVTPTSVPGLDLIAPPPSLNKVPGGEGQFFQKQREKVLGRDPTPPYQEWATAPLVNLPGPITVAKYVERKIDESQGNPIGKAFLKGAIEQTLQENPKLTGLGESGAKAVSGMTSPAMIGTAVAAPLLPAKLAAGAFSAWQGYNTVKDFPRVKQTILDPNVPNYQKWEAGGDEFASLAFTVAPLVGMTVAKLKSTMTPDQAANVLKEKLPAQPKPPTQEVPNAPQERQVQEGVQRERVGTDAQRVSTEAGPGNIVQPAAEVRPQQPQPEAPQVPLTPPGVNPTAKEWLTHAAYEDEGGDVYTGSNHPEILENLGIEGFDTRESRNTSQFGFRTNLRAFVPREEAAKIAKASGQQLEPFEIGPKGEPVAHSDQAASPTEPGKTIAEQKPLNPGGALKDLPPELQKKSNAVKDAMRAEFEKLKKQAEKPKSPTEVLSTSAQVKVKSPEGATFIRDTTKKGQVSTLPISNFKGDNPFKGEEWKKVEAGTMSKGKFIPMKGEVTVDPQIVGLGGATYGEVAPTGFSESGAYGGDIYGIAERVRKARAEAGQVEPVEPGQGTPAEGSVERGRELLDQGVDPEKVLSEFEKTKRFSGDDVAVMRARGEQLALIARRIEEQFGTDSDEYALAFKNLSDWDRRTKGVQTEWSQAGRAQQGETDVDTGSFTGLQRERLSKTGKEIPPEKVEKAKRLAKNVAKARKEADDANQMLLKTIDEEGRSIKPGTENKAVWDTVRKYAKRGMDDFNDIVNKTASDLGMKVEDVRKELSKRPAVKRMTDEAYKKAQTLRRIHGNAKMWLNALDTPEVLKQLESIPGFMFGLKVWGHGRVALGTHAPLVAFLPEYWKTYAKNYATMYKMVHDPAFYEVQMQDLKRRPNYVTAQRAGLQNDVFQYEDYVSPEYVKFFGAGRGGNRGYAVLKILRQDMFDHQWDRLPDELKTPEVAKMIAKDVNHITGVTQKRAFKHANVAFFAPRLLASRMAWLIGDPAQTLRITAKWKTATPAEKFFAINQVKQKAWVIGTAMSMLAINQGMLLALGSKQKVNGVPKALGGAGFDPMSSDFMKFKVDGMQFSYGNPMIALARLPLRLWATRNESQKQRRGAYPDESMITEVGRYFRTQLSPFSGLLADAVTKTDYANRPLPGTNLPVPSRIRREGKGPYTWPEYISQVALPIPFEEAAKEVWENGFGLGKEQLKQAAKALFTIAVMGGTGGRLTEDWRLKEEEQPKMEPTAFQPPPGFQITQMQPVNQPPQR